MLIDMHVIKQTQKRNLKKMSPKAWGQIPMFFLPVPPWPRVCPPSETQAVVSPERKTLALLRIPQAFVWHGAACTQGLNRVMLFSTLDTELQRGLPVRWLREFYDSLLYNFIHVPSVKIKESRTQTWWPQISLWCRPHFPGTVMTMLKESKKWKEHKTGVPNGLLKNQANMFGDMFWKGTVLF